MVEPCVDVAVILAYKLVRSDVFKRRIPMSSHCKALTILSRTSHEVKFFKTDFHFGGFLKSLEP